MQTTRTALPPIDWSSPTFWGLIVIHAVGIVSLPLALVGILSVSWQMWVFATALAIGRGAIGIGAGYHRYFAHPTYKFVRWPRLSQFLVAVIGSSAGQGGVIWWSGMHRDHHHFTDKPGDPHSPKLYGYWWAHMGWLFRKRTPPISNTKDLTRYRELVWLEKWHFIFPLALAIACFVFGGVSGLLIGFFLSTTIVYQATFCVNSAAHSSGEEENTSRNIWWMSLFAPIGEQWHRNHHRKPNSPRSGEQWWQLDLSYNWLQLLHLIGHIKLKHAPS